MRKRVLNYKWATTVKLCDRLQMPKASGLYVVRNGKEVLYVGVAKEFRSRWSAHHRRADIEAVTDKATVSCFRLEHGYAYALEPVWFRYLKPSLQRYEWDAEYLQSFGMELTPTGPMLDDMWRFGLQLVEVAAANAARLAQAAPIAVHSSDGDEHPAASAPRRPIERHNHSNPIQERENDARKTA